MPRVVTTAWGWVVLALVIAFLTPTGQFLLRLNATLRTEGSANVELPITALRVWFIVTPLFAFLPPFALLFVWWRAQKAGTHRSVNIRRPLAFAGVLLTAALTFCSRERSASVAGTPQPCSQQGTSVIRVQLLDPDDRPPAVAANAVILALSCGAVMRPDGIAEITAVPPGDHTIQVRAIGFPPDSLQVTIGTADTVQVTAHLPRALQ